MPYKDPNKRKELIKKHYNSNKDYYKKKANKWKENNREKVIQSRIRYQKKINLKKELDLILSLKKEGDNYTKEAKSFCLSIQDLIFEILEIDKLENISEASFMKILDEFINDKNNLASIDNTNKSFYEKVYNPAFNLVKSNMPDK